MRRRRTLTFIRKGASPMQPPSSRKAGWPKSFATTLRLPIADAITTVLLLTLLSNGVQSESAATIATSPTSCPNELIQNGGFEFVDYPSSTRPRNWNASLWAPFGELIYDNTTRHFGYGSAKITAATANDAWLWQEVTVE